MFLSELVFNFLETFIDNPTVLMSTSDITKITEKENCLVGDFNNQLKI